MAAVLSFERRCAQCGAVKPADHFIGRRGKPVTYCAECRTKYYGGAEHVAGAANVGENRSRDAVRSSREGMGLGARKRTENVARLPKRELEAGRVHLRVLQADGDDMRPRTRGDCASVPRPCPFVSCKWNLYLDVTDIGSITYRFGDREPDEMPADFSCALDVADQGGATLEDIGRMANVTRERIRQLETKALLQFRKNTPRARILRELADVPEGATLPPIRQSGTGSLMRRAERPEAPERDDAVDDAPPTRLSFFAHTDVDADGIEAVERADEAACRAVWTMFVKDSNARGFSVRSSKARDTTMSPWRQAKAVTGESKEETKPMNATMTNGASSALSNDLRTALTAYNTLKKELGRVPMATEIAPKLGIGVSAVRYRIGELAKMKLAEKAPRGGNTARGDGAKKVTKKPRNALVALPSSPKTKANRGLEGLDPPQKPSRTASSDPVVSALIERRDALLAKAAAIDVAIEAMAVPL